MSNDLFTTTVTALRELREEHGDVYADTVNCMMQFRCIQGGLPNSLSLMRFTMLTAQLLAIICKSAKIDHNKMTADCDRLVAMALREHKEEGGL